MDREFNLMKELDSFFSQFPLPDMSGSSIRPLLSNCCGAKAYGELFKGFGRCSDCLEMAEFKETEK